MKLITLFVALALTSLAFAESAFEKKRREEMLTRTDSLISKVKSARENLKKEDVVKACDDIRELLKIYPEHLKAIGMHMDNHKTKVVIMRDEVLQQLIFMHRQSLVCEQGAGAEHVDPKDLGKKLSRIEKKLGKQRKRIKRESTDFANDFYYRYEF